MTQVIQNSALTTLSANTTLTSAVAKYQSLTREGWLPELFQPGDTAISLIDSLNELACDLYVEADQIQEGADYDPIVLTDLAFSLRERISRLSTLLGLPPTTFYRPS